MEDEMLKSLWREIDRAHQERQAWLAELDEIVNKVTNEDHPEEEEVVIYEARVDRKRTRIFA